VSGTEWLPGNGEMTSRIRAHDWTKTPLGPMEAWTQSLKTALGIVLSMDQPAGLAWGPELAFVYNDAWRRMFGTDEHVVRLGQSVGLSWPEIWDVIAPEYEQVMTGGEPVRHERRLLPIERHGRLEDIHWTYTHLPVGDPEALHSVGGVLTLITETSATVMALQAADDRQDFLLRLNDALRPLGDAGSIEETLTRLVGEELGADWVVYGQIDEAKDIVDIGHGYARNGEPPITGEQPLSAFGWAAKVYKTGATLVVSDTQSSDRLTADERPAIAALGMIGLISVPLLKDGVLVGALAISQRKPRTWTAAEIQLAEGSAERIWAAMQRAHAEAAMRDGEERFRVMADAVPQIVWITDAYGRMEFFNKQWRDYTGVTELPKTATDVAASAVHPDDEERTMAAFEEARRTGDPFRVEHRVRSKTGEYRWFLVRAEPYRDPSTKKISRWFGASVDIEERKKAEDILREKEDRQAFLLSLSDTLRPLTETGDIMAAAAAALGRHLQAGQVIYAEADPTGEFVNIEREWNDGTIPSNARLHRLDDFGPAFIADLRQGKTTVIGDVGQDPRTDSEAALATFKRATIASLVNVPLVKNGRLVAVLGVHSAIPRTWTDQEVGLAEDMAERTWAALERARAEAALRESEVRFRAIVERTRDYAIFTTDAEGRIDSWPPGAEAVFGWTATEAIGQKIDMTFTPEDRARGEPARELQTAAAEGHAPNVRWHTAQGWKPSLH
jgi:PAS domain S-box-containing protein